MCVTTIPEIKFITNDNICHSYLMDFFIASAVISKYTIYYKENRNEKFEYETILKEGRLSYGSIKYTGAATKKMFSVFPGELIPKFFYDDRRDHDIPYKTANIPESPTDPIILSNSQATTNERLIQSTFISFWEDNLDTIIELFGKRKSGEWPPLLEFSALIRDALSHGGEIKIFHNKPISYYNLSYSQHDNGKRIIHTDISVADIIILMLEISEAIKHKQTI